MEAEPILDCSDYSLVRINDRVPIFIFRFATLNLEAVDGTFKLSEFVIQKNVKYLIIDWNNLDNLCTHIMGPFVGIYKRISLRKGSMYSINIIENTKKALDLYGYSSLFALKNSIEEIMNVIR